MTELDEILDLLAMLGPTSPSNLLRFLGTERRPGVLDALRVLARRGHIVIDRGSGLVHQAKSQLAMS